MARDRSNSSKEISLIPCDLKKAKTRFGDIVKDAPFRVPRLSIFFRITHEMTAWINKKLGLEEIYIPRHALCRCHTGSREITYHSMGQFSGTKSRTPRIPRAVERYAPNCCPVSMIFYTSNEVSRWLYLFLLRLTCIHTIIGEI